MYESSFRLMSISKISQISKILLLGALFTRGRCEEISENRKSPQNQESPCLKRTATHYRFDFYLLLLTLTLDKNIN